MNKVNASTSDRLKHPSPGVRAHAVASRKRFQCDLFGFWQQCGRHNCRRRRGCDGDPHDCFRRHHAAIPRDHEDRLRAELLSRTRGTGTAERVLRAAGLSMPRGIRSQRGKLSSPRRANAAAGAVVPVQQGEAGRVANAAMDVLADLERALRELGITPRRAIEPQPAVRLPSRRADAAGHVAVAERTSPASPDPGTAGPAPLANCDEQGRLILPDRTEYIERIRRGMTWAEMAAKGRV